MRGCSPNAALTVVWPIVRLIVKRLRRDVRHLPLRVRHAHDPRLPSPGEDERHHASRVIVAVARTALDRVLRMLEGLRFLAHEAHDHFDGDVHRLRERVGVRREQSGSRAKIAHLGIARVLQGGVVQEPDRGHVVAALELEHGERCAFSLVQA